MIRPPPRSTPFPYTTLSRSTGVVENRALGGSAIVMNPRTGEILALANEPTFNPNAYRDFDDGERRNRAIQDLYEPGSRSEEHTSELQSQSNLVCRLLLEKKK